MRPCAVLFDFDGVIVNSLAYHLDAWQKAVDWHFGQALSVELARRITGHATQVIGGMLATHFSAPEKAAALADTKRRFLVEDGHGIHLLPGVSEVFALLKANGVPFGVASNAPRAYITSLMVSHGLSAPVVMGIEDAGAPKPSPDPYLVCAQRLGVSAVDFARTLVFEDSVHGLTAGLNAGMAAIGVTTENSAETLLDAGAIATCADLSEAMAKGWFERVPGA